MHSRDKHRVTDETYSRVELIEFYWIFILGVKWDEKMCWTDRKNVREENCRGMGRQRREVKVGKARKGKRNWQNEGKYWGEEGITYRNDKERGRTRKNKQRWTDCTAKPNVLEQIPVCRTKIEPTADIWSPFIGFSRAIKIELFMFMFTLVLHVYRLHIFLFSLEMNKQNPSIFVSSRATFKIHQNFKIFFLQEKKTVEFFRTRFVSGELCELHSKWMCGKSFEDVPTQSARKRHVAVKAHVQWRTHQSRSVRPYLMQRIHLDGIEYCRVYSWSHPLYPFADRQWDTHCSFSFGFSSARTHVERLPTIRDSGCNTQWHRHTWSEREK